MATVSASFTDVGAGGQLLVRSGEKFTYDVSGTFVATVVLEKSQNSGASWESITSATAAASGTVVIENTDRSHSIVRFRCSVFTSGTVVTALADVAEVVQEFKNNSGQVVLSLTETGVSIPGTLGVTGASTLTGGASVASGVFNSSQATNVASAATIDLDVATGNLVDVTGVVTITAITLSQGRQRTVRFTGALTLTHGASLVLPNAANITTAAGDYAIFAGYASGVVRCVSYVKANGTPISFARTAQKRIICNGAKIGAGAGFVVNAADDKNSLARVPAGVTAGTLVIPLSNLKVGDTITSFHLVGQIESAGNHVTVDVGLRKQLAAAADLVDSSIATMTQLDVVADTIMSVSNTNKASLTQVVAADETYYLLITVTTGASTDVDLQAAAITVTEA